MRRRSFRRYGRATKVVAPSGRVEYEYASPPGGAVTKFTNSVLYEVGWYWQTTSEPYWVGPFHSRKQAADDMRRMSR